MTRSLLFSQIEQILQKYKQTKLLAKIYSLSSLEQLALYHALRKIEIKSSIPIQKRREKKSLYLNAEESSKELEMEGEKLLQKGMGAVLLFAGGMSSRAQSKLPKAIIPLPNGETLLSLFCKKLNKYQEKYHHHFPFLLMVSDTTHKEIFAYLKKHHFFSLPEESVEIFLQGNYPFKDTDGNWLLQKGKIIELPSGNGDVFSAISHTKFFEKKIYRSYRYLHMANVDNLLADPLSPSLMGYAERKKADITFQVFSRKKMDKGVGVVVGKEPDIRIEEYCEREEQPSLGYGNIGHYCFSIASLEKVLHNEKALPFHWVEKEWKGIKGYKAEKFIFDIFEHFEKIYPLSFDKEKNFYPLKRREDFLLLPLKQLL